ncbi:hypothetical protein R6Q57_028182 [Mikania cordata]
MATHLSDVFFNKASISPPVLQRQRRPPFTVFATASAAPPPSSPPTIQANNLLTSRIDIMSAELDLTG